MKLRLAVLFSALAANAIAADLKIHAINVGWGESVLIEGPNGSKLLFDSGLPTKKNVVLNYLSSQGITQLDYFLVSHNHNDHGGSAQFVAFATKPKHSYFSGSANNTNLVFMKNWFAYYNHDAVQTPPSAPVAAIPGTSFDLGDGATATIVAANCKVIHQNAVIAKLRETKPNYTYPPCAHVNDQSIVLLVKYKTFDYLVSGDLGGTTFSNQQDFETPVATALSISPEPELHTIPGTIDVLHVGHHGSKTSTNSNYIQFAGAKVALVSVGPNQTFGLPNKEAIQPLLDAGALVLQTDAGPYGDRRTYNKGAIVGNILITTDGLQFTIGADSTALDTKTQPDVKSDADAIGLPKAFQAH